MVNLFQRLTTKIFIGVFDNVNYDELEFNFIGSSPNFRAYGFGGNLVCSKANLRCLCFRLTQNITTLHIAILWMIRFHAYVRHIHVDV